MSKGEGKASPPLRKDIDIDKPRWSQETYAGRARHFFTVTNPLNIFVTNTELDRCKEIVTNYKAGKPVPESMTEDDLWQCKHLYDSAFHPDTGEKMTLIGRMSAQVPMNTLITGGMMTFYKSTPAVLFWQWINQSFNAIVNYTNRSGASPISEKQLMSSYVAATTGAVATALTLNHYAKRAPPLVARFVPFVAVAAANMVNIPMMRAQELKKGIPVLDSEDRESGLSKICAQRAIAATLFSRVIMATPSMIVTPIIIHKLDRRGFFKCRQWMVIPVTCLIVAGALTFATPMACALFKQRSEIKVSKLETDLQERMKNSKVAYYNKGL